MRSRGERIFGEDYKMRVMGENVVWNGGMEMGKARRYKEYCLNI